MSKQQNILVTIEVSARHLHLSKQDAGILFGQGHELQKLKKLSQGDNFAAKEMVTLAQPAAEPKLEKRKTNEIKNVRAVGPYWEKTVVELSRTDAVRLGINPPIKDSLAFNNSPQPANIVLIGPRGKIVRPAAIIPQRHLYITPKQLENLNKQWGANFKAGDMVSVQTKGKRSIIFKNILLRVDQNYKLRFFIDTDEANSAGLKGGEEGELIHTLTPRLG